MNSLNIPKPSEINLKIPEELLVKDVSIDFSVLKNKKLVGLLGIASSGKDTVADYFVDNYGYKKLKFGDILKHTLNQYFKEIVMEDLVNRNIPISFSEIDFLVEDDRILKEKLRPYMIWLGENLRERNGVHFWINKALEKITNSEKIVIADIRRDAELDLFRNNNFALNKMCNSFGAANILDSDRLSNVSGMSVDYDTRLFYVNQFGLEDQDEITMKTIEAANREWLIEDTVYIDSRIPDEGDARSKYIESVSKRLAGKHGLYV